MTFKTALRGLLLAAMCGASAGGCAPTEVELTQPGWRAIIELPGGALPVQMAFSRDASGKLAAAFINGEEQVAVGEVTETADALTLAFPAFNNRIELTRADGGYDGTLKLVKRGGVTQVMRVSLRPNQPFRFFAGEQDINADFAGKWSVTFTDDDGVTTAAVAELSQINGLVTGTIRTPTGDYRYLAGQVRDRTLSLSTFDGAHAFLFELEQDERGLVNGHFWSGTQWHETLVARRDAMASLPDPNSMSRIKEGVDRVDFTFLNTRREPVSLSDARFAGKVVIVALAGTWCPNCHDEAAFLAPYYATNQPRGLEVIGLMFEHLEDFEAAATQVRRFREKFDIQYELLVAGYSDKTAATATLGWLDRVIAYPTMVVFDRAGEVRLIHTGFEGPGTGVHYDEFRASFTAFIDQLLQEDSV